MRAATDQKANRRLQPERLFDRVRDRDRSARNCSNLLRVGRDAVEQATEEIASRLVACDEQIHQLGADHPVTHRLRLHVLRHANHAADAVLAFARQSTALRDMGVEVCRELGMELPESPC